MLSASDGFMDIVRVYASLMFISDGTVTVGCVLLAMLRFCALLVQPQGRQPANSFKLFSLLFTTSR